MAKRWLIGLVAAIAVVSMAGVGFSAFTAQATVYGNATAATLDLKIVNEGLFSPECQYWLPGLPTAPASMKFVGLDPSETQITWDVANLTPNVLCNAWLVIENAGSIPVNLSVALNTPGSNGICTAWENNCYDINTISGIQANGWIYWLGSPTGGTSSYSYANVVTLDPGATYEDLLTVDIPPASDDSTPSSATFSLVYTATPTV